VNEELYVSFVVNSFFILFYL